ncbi:FkbM family methyltransferase [bacterium]|nr:FkbM family methyltransferase [bacterium]
MALPFLSIKNLNINKIKKYMETINKIKPIIKDEQGFNALIKGKEGYIVYNKNDIYIGKAIEKYGEFSEHEIKLFDYLCHSGDIIIDIGANIGTHTLAFSRIVGDNGKVYAYEPQKIIFYTLCANVAINSITNIECKHQAVGNDTGYIKIPDFNYNLEGNYGGISVDKFTMGIKVEIIKLDSLIELQKINFIKIDVEGMEYDVINGAKEVIKKFKPIIYVENDRLDKSKKLIKLIKSLNYRIFWHNPPPI